MRLTATTIQCFNTVIRSSAARILIFARVEIMTLSGPCGWRGRDACSPVLRARDCATT
jgi:hypothetical protein